MMMVKLMFLPMMIKVLSKTHRPFVCAFLYLGLVITNDLMFEAAFGATWQAMALESGKAFGGSALYFWLLNELEGSDGPYYGVLALGLLVLLLV